MVMVSLGQPRADTLGLGLFLCVSHSILFFLSAGCNAGLACGVKVAATGQTADTHVGVGRTAMSTNRVTGALECVEGDEHVGGALENFNGVALERKGAIRSTSALTVKVFRPWVHRVGGGSTWGQILAYTDASCCVKVALLGGVIAAREFGSPTEQIAVIGVEELSGTACSPTGAASLAL